MRGTVLGALIGVAMPLAACGKGTTTPQVPAQVEVDPGSLMLLPGDTARLTAVAFTADGQRISGAAFRWASSDSNVVRVSSSGFLRGVAAGSATIEARSGGAIGRATVRVNLDGTYPLVAVNKEALPVQVSWQTCSMGTTPARVTEGHATFKADSVILFHWIWEDGCPEDGGRRFNSPLTTRGTYAVEGTALRISTSAGRAIGEGRIEADGISVPYKCHYGPGCSPSHCTTSPAGCTPEWYTLGFAKSSVTTAWSWISGKRMPGSSRVP